MGLPKLFMKFCIFMGLPLLWSFCPQTQASGLQAPAIIFIFELSLKNWAVFNLYSKRTQFFSFLNLTHQPQCVCQPCEIGQLGWSRVGRGHNIQRPCNIIRSNLFSVLVKRRHSCSREGHNHVGRGHNIQRTCNIICSNLYLILATISEGCKGIVNHTTRGMMSSPLKPQFLLFSSLLHLGSDIAQLCRASW